MTDVKSIATVVLLCIYVTGAIRNLKEGPMIGPDSRQYKTATLPRDDLTDVPTNRAPPVSTNRAPPVSTNRAPPVPTNRAPPVPTNRAPPVPTNRAPPVPTNRAPPVPTNRAPPVPTSRAVPVSTSRAVTVQVLCTERTMIVFIRADLYSNGRRVTAEELRLGRSTESCKASQYSNTEYVIEADLHQCGSELSIDGDRLVYSNQLIYTPTQNSYSIVRTSGAAIPIECHYKRTHFVSTVDVRPSFEPSTSMKSAKERITFSFQLMSDDWRGKRSSYVYHLGEIMNIQASFSKAGHAPFKLMMDSCVATLKPDSTSVPRYVFIQNHGCLIDSKAPHSKARFLPRNQNHILQMQMDAFRFDEVKNSIYITCHLKIVDLKVNVMNKACTYSGNRWLCVDGKDEVCECCETVCDNQKQIGKWNRLPKRSVSADSTVSKIMMLGPIKVLD